MWSLIESTFIGLIQNIAMLLAFVVVFDQFSQRWRTDLIWIKRILVGIVIGIIGIAIMKTPVLFIPGVVFDTRSVVLGISGLFFGLVPTLVAMGITAAYRLSQGGVGALTGVYVILATGSIGWIWRKVRNKKFETFSWQEFLLFGLALHVVMLALMMTLPADTAKQVLTVMGLPILIIYPIGTALICLLIRDKILNEKARESLHRSEIILNTTQQLSKVGGWEWDAAAQTVFWTDETYRIHGLLAREDYPDSKDIFDISINCYLPEDRPTILKAFKDCVEKGEPYDLEFPFVTTRGDSIWVRTIGQPVREKGKIVRVNGNIMDITDQKRAQDALVDRESYISTILDNLPLGIAVNSVEPAVVFTYMNDNFVDIYRTTREKLVDPDDFWSAVYEDPEFREVIRKRVLDDVNSGDRSRLSWEDIPITRVGEETTYITAMNIPLTQKSMMISTVWDVTQRKRAEDDLRESESKFRAMFQNNHAVMLILDPENGRIVDANPAASEYYGWTTEELTQKFISDINTLSKDELQPELEKAAAHERNYFQYRHRLSSGEIRDVEVFSGPIRQNQRTLLYSIIHDVTERVQAQAELLSRMDELERFHRITVGRELKMIDLKAEVNDLLVQVGKPHKYQIPE